jgi:hypothetical protein
MPGYLDQFLADDGLLMVPQLLHQAIADGHRSAKFAGDIKATYLFVVIEALLGRPFVDTGMASRVASYGVSNNAAVNDWEGALQQRLSGRLRGRIDISAHPDLKWTPEFGGQGGRYLPDMALLCLDLGVDPGDVTAVGVQSPGPQAHSAVAAWVLGRRPVGTDAEVRGWRDIVLRGPSGGHRQYLHAATSLVVTQAASAVTDVREQVALTLDRIRGVDGVPWLLPSGVANESGGDLLASLAGLYFDIAATGKSAEDILRGRADFETSLGAHL